MVNTCGGSLLPSTSTSQVKTAGGTPSWEQLPASTGQHPILPPLPLRYPGAPPNSSGSRLQAQLQEWLFGPRTPVSYGSASSAAASGSSHGAAAVAGGVVMTGGSGLQAGHSTSCLATGSDWSEVVQVRLVLCYVQFVLWRDTTCEATVLHSSP